MKLSGAILFFVAVLAVAGQTGVVHYAGAV